MRSIDETKPNSLLFYHSLSPISMHIRRLAPLFVLLMVSFTCYAQQSPRCGLDHLLADWLGDDPQRMAAYRDYQQDRQQWAEAASTAKGPSQLRIPVVFQVILNQAQYNSIRQEQGLRRRIASQIDALNRDFNAQNSDKS